MTPPRRLLARQRRSRKRLATAVAGWVALSHAEEVDGLPVTTVEARNAAGRTVTVRITATITPARKAQP